MLPPSYEETMKQGYGATAYNPGYSPVHQVPYPPSDGAPHYVEPSAPLPAQMPPPPQVPPPPAVMDVDIGGVSSDEDGFAASRFNSTSIRHGFIRKVYLILTSQLCVTLALVAIFQFVQPIKIWVQKNPWFYYTSFVIFLVVYIVLVCCEGIRRRFPHNFIALIVFTLTFSYMAATIASFYDTPAVLSALGITAALCCGLSLFACQTKIDFTLCSGFIFVLCWTLFLFGLAVLIVWRINGTSRLMEVVYASLGVIVFSLFLVFDTQLIMGGHKLEFSPEEYIMGALQLYLDVMYIFLFILSIFGIGSRS